MITLETRAWVKSFDCTPWLMPFGEYLEKAGMNASHVLEELQELYMAEMQELKTRCPKAGKLNREVIAITMCERRMHKICEELNAFNLGFAFYGFDFNKRDFLNKN